MDSVLECIIDIERITDQEPEIFANGQEGESFEVMATIPELNETVQFTITKHPILPDDLFLEVVRRQAIEYAWARVFERVSNGDPELVEEE